jgi:hypothetical protein
MAMTDQAEPPIDPRAAARREGEAETWDGKAIHDWISTPHGRRLMERILDDCHVYAGAITTTAIRTAWRGATAAPMPGISCKA